MTNRTKRIIALTLAAAACCAALRAENWLSGLRDDTPVCRLALPGTHNSATGEGFRGLAGRLAGNRRARTQDASLAEQWDSGIRVFDLRPAAVRRGRRAPFLRICHGIATTRMRFDEALRLLSRKVQENPGEFAIVIVRREHPGRRDADEMWRKLMRECLKSAELAGRLADFAPELTVGGLRGKILVLSRDIYEDRGCPAGGYLRGWTHSADPERQKQALVKGTAAASCPLFVQDCYDSTRGRLGAKIAALRAMADEGIRLAATADERPVWIINHASGYTARSSNGYRDHAARTNAALIYHLNDSGATAAAGIVMMDYAAADSSKGRPVRGRELTRTLIACNAVYAADGQTSPDERPKTE
ncbi:MAG: hypothetical protein J1F06_05850 [Prevotellaceae bacterium]|nr:hypothetical protein [Prevotellaceae bacterium]